MNRFRTILAVSILCTILLGITAMCHDEDFERYGNISGDGVFPSASLWFVSENSGNGGKIRVIEDGEGNNALKFELSTTARTWTGSYINVTTADGADKFLISMRIKVATDTQGTFELYLRGGSGTIGGGSLILLTKSATRTEYLAGLGNNKVTENNYKNGEYIDVAVWVDRQNDLIIAYRDGKEMARANGYLAANMPGLEYGDMFIRLNNYVNANNDNVKKSEVYIDDFLFRNNVSELPGIYCSAPDYKTVSDDQEHGMFFVGDQVGSDSVKVRSTVINLLNKQSPVMVALAAWVDDVLKDIDLHNVNLSPLQKAYLETEINYTAQDITDIKTYVLGAQSIEPIITPGIPAELVSPFPANIAGQTYLRNSFAVHEVSGIMYYNNKKVIPSEDDQPIMHNDQMYIALSHIYAAFGDRLKDVESGDISGITTIDGKPYVNLATFRVGNTDLGSYTTYNKLHVIGKNTTASNEQKDSAVTYMRFERPDIHEIRQLVEENNGQRPRILLNKEDYDRIKAYYDLKDDPELDPDAKKAVVEAINLIIQRSDRLITHNTTPIQYKLEGTRLLEACRQVLSRLQDLSFAYTFTKDTKYYDRAWTEINNVLNNYPNWNAHQHFLDPSEMMAGFSVAYDSFYDVLSNNRKTRMRNAMLNNGIRPAYQVYRKASSSSSTFWRENAYNWSSVCNGGMVMGALAIVDDITNAEDKYICLDVITNAIRSVEYMMPTYDPDGSWAEGASYWDYATMYLMRMMLTLESSLGTDFGLTKVEGLKHTAEFAAHSLGLAGNNSGFNFHDAWTINMNAAEFFWLARKMDDPNIAALRFAAMNLYDNVTPTIFDAIGYRDHFSSESAQVSLDAVFNTSDELHMQAHRSSWDDPNGMYIASQGGKVDLPHAHYDNGSFVLDNGGVRWIEDLGAENYDLSVDQGKIYRGRTEGHNTLVINPGEDIGQIKTAFNPIEKFQSSLGAGFGIMNLTSAYANDANSVRRGLGMFNDRKNAVIRDEITLKGTKTVYWFANTKAEINHDQGKQQFRLTQSGKTLYMKYEIDGGDAYVTVGNMKAEPLSESNIDFPGGQNENKDYRKMYFKFENATGDIKINVMFTANESDPLIMDQPLSEWTVEQQEQE